MEKKKKKKRLLADFIDLPVNYNISRRDPESQLSRGYRSIDSCIPKVKQTLYCISYAISLLTNSFLMPYLYVISLWHTEGVSKCYRISYIAII